MSDVYAIPKTYDEAVELLAQWHMQPDATDMEIYAAHDPEGQVVRLIEVSDSFMPTGRATAWSFGKSKEFPFRSSVVQITHDEWSQVQNRTIPLPSGWALEELRKVRP